MYKRRTLLSHVLQGGKLKLKLEMKRYSLDVSEARSSLLPSSGDLEIKNSVIRVIFNSENTSHHKLNSMICHKRIKRNYIKFRRPIHLTQLITTPHTNKLTKHLIHYINTSNRTFKCKLTIVNVICTKPINK
jgi:hypothetical protein